MSNVNSVPPSGLRRIVNVPPRMTFIPSSTSTDGNGCTATAIGPNFLPLGKMTAARYKSDSPCTFIPFSPIFLSSFTSGSLLATSGVIIVKVVPVSHRARTGVAVHCPSWNTPIWQSISSSVAGRPKVSAHNLDFS